MTLSSQIGETEPSYFHAVKLCAHASDYVNLPRMWLPAQTRLVIHYGGRVVLGSHAVRIQVSSMSLGKTEVATWMRLCRC